MRRRTALVRAFGLGAASFAAVVCAHVLDYWLLVPSPIKRAAALIGSGHSYASRAPVWAIASALVGIASALVLGWSRDQSRPEPIPLRRSAVLLTLVQMGGFLSVETLERVYAHTGYGSFFGAALALGLVVQLAISLASVTALWLLSRGAEAVARWLRAAPRRSPGTLPVVAVVATTIRSRRPDAIYSSRAPPAPLPA